MPKLLIRLCQASDINIFVIIVNFELTRFMFAGLRIVIVVSSVSLA